MERFDIFVRRDTPHNQAFVQATPALGFGVFGIWQPRTKHWLVLEQGMEPINSIRRDLEAGGTILLTAAAFDTHTIVSTFEQFT